MRDAADPRAGAIAFWPELVPFVGGGRQITPAPYRRGTRQRPYAPGLVLIGEAAHPTSPHLGQGANTSQFDALAPATAIATCDLAGALPRHADLRRWHLCS